MAFDWIRFLDRYGVPHETQGRHARRGWVSVACPWCGPAEPHHLGIRVDIGIYKCWHGASHSGKNPARLVAALLRCSDEEARQVVGSTDTSFARSDDFADDAMRRLGLTAWSPRRGAGSLDFLPEFTPDLNRGLSARLALPYLRERGYDTDDALRLAHRYKLMFASSGAFAYRIIVPVFVDGRLVTWTGRTVARSDSLRYKSLSSDPDRAAQQGLPAALASIKETLLDWDNIQRGGETLVLTEGPFDALRVGSLGEGLGVRATCLFSKAASPRQLDLVYSVAGRYNRVVALFDRDARHDSFLTVPDYFDVEEVALPPGVKDPAELDFDGLRRALRL